MRLSAPKILKSRLYCPDVSYEMGQWQFHVWKCGSYTVAFIASPTFKIQFPRILPCRKKRRLSVSWGQPATFFSTVTLVVVGHICLSSLLSNKSNIHSKVLSYLTWTSWKASIWTIFSWSVWPCLPEWKVLVATKTCKAWPVLQRWRCCNSFTIDVAIFFFFKFGTERFLINKNFQRTRLALGSPSGGNAQQREGKPPQRDIMNSPILLLCKLHLTSLFILSVMLASILKIQESWIWYMF